MGLGRLKIIVIAVTSIALWRKSWLGARRAQLALLYFQLTIAMAIMQTSNLKLLIIVSLPGLFYQRKLYQLLLLPSDLPPGGISANEAKTRRSNSRLRAG